MSAGYGFFGRAEAQFDAGRDAGPARCSADAQRAGQRDGLRSALRNAQDGVIATATLLVGVAAAGIGRGDLSIVGLACLAAGALAMAAGECVADSAPAAGGEAGRALAAAGAFAGGGSPLLLIAAVAPLPQLLAWLAAGSLLLLGTLGAAAASIGGSRPLGAGVHAASWGAAAMASAAAVGSFSGPLV